MLISTIKYASDYNVGNTEKSGGLKKDILGSSLPSNPFRATSNNSSIATRVPPTYQPVKGCPLSISITSICWEGEWTLPFYRTLHASLFPGRKSPARLPPLLHSLPS